MSLRFVTGEKKTGKTTFLLEEIKQKIQSKKQVIYIVPEQMVFRAEAYILDRLGEQQAFLVETLSFSKLAASLLRKRPDLKLLQLLDSCSKKLILHKVMGGLKDRLSVYAGASGNPRMVALLSENITELKKYGVDEKRLEEILQEQDLSDNLRRKLTDIREILHSYEQELCGLYQDHDDMLTMACRELDAGELEDADVYIDGFVGFTLQEAQMIGSLLTHQNRVTITLTMTPEEDSYYGKRFYTTWLTRGWHRMPACRWRKSGWNKKGLSGKRFVFSPRIFFWTTIEAVKANRSISCWRNIRICRGSARASRRTFCAGRQSRGCVLGKPR